jgi:lysozyme
MAAALLVVPMSARPEPTDRAPASATVSPTLAAATVQEAAGPYLITAERRALLNTIRFAEGTWLNDSAAGYRVLYGGGRFSDLSRHPEITIRRRYVSAAAGAYQFLPGTWQRAAERLRLRDFRPTSQDQAALHLVQERGALASFDRQGLSAEVLARLAPEWASLPTLRGESHYGQPVKRREELQGFYQRELERQKRLASA